MLEMVGIIPSVFVIDISSYFPDSISSNKCHASSNKCLTSSNKKLLAISPCSESSSPAGTSNENMQ